MAVQPVPPGCHTVTPSLIVKDAARAMSPEEMNRRFTAAMAHGDA